MRFRRMKVSILPDVEKYNASMIAADAAIPFPFTEKNDHATQQVWGVSNGLVASSQDSM